LGGGIYDGDNLPTKPTDVKELVVWIHKNNKAYILIATLVSEEVNRYTNSIIGA